MQNKPIRTCWQKLPQASQEVAERNARNATAEAKKRFGKRARITTAYKCPVCDLWHLTTNKKGK